MAGGRGFGIPIGTADMASLMSETSYIQSIWIEIKSYWIRLGVNFCLVEDKLKLDHKSKDSNKTIRKEHLHTTKHQT